MNHSIKTKKGIQILGAGIMMIALLVSAINIQAQDKYKCTDAKITVNGTSNIHDWVMQGTNGSVSASFSSEGGKLKNLLSLAFTFPVKNLKSEHKLMDKNCYNAMKADKYPNVSFTGTSAVIKQNANGTYQINCKGKLKIADAVKDVELIAICTINSDNSLSITGNFKLKMTDYNVEPPSIMMGSIVTGNDVSINYTLHLNKQ
ncbi:MAG: YceI family protein [Bacteroidetes bacterium]|nr:YceI family protein [Bacteroidota bacterium]